MSIFEDTNPRTLKNLLVEIHDRNTALPNFQRDFVWDPGATQELIVSIANNYPAGSILRVRDNRLVFAAREFEGAPRLNGARHTFLILDGQQRLTSLYQAFYGVGEHRYYLNLQKLIDGEDFEDAIFHVRANTRWAREREDFTLQAQELLLPLSVLMGGVGFLQWMFEVINLMPSLDDRTLMQDSLIRLNKKWFMPIDAYVFPVVTLSEETEPEALCTIFETLNRTGVKLSVFELLTARFWTQNINLRDLWDRAIEANAIIEEFEVDPYYILQAIALASRKSPSCKRSDVLILTAQDINVWWPRVIEGLATGLSLLRDDCKVMLPKWIPYQTMIAPLAAVLAKAGLPMTPEAGAQREKLKRWFWCSVFGQAYESSPNTQAANDVDNLIEWFRDEQQFPAVISSFSFDPNILRDVTPRQRAIYRGTICLILGSGTGARDFFSQGIITGRLMNLEGIDDHHIFPVNFLRNTLGVQFSRLRDCVLNRTLIDRTTNQKISDQAPSVYLAQIRATTGFPFDSVLESHCLPTGNDSPFWNDNFGSFLSWRQNRLWQEIQRVTGLRQAAALEAG